MFLKRILTRIAVGDWIQFGGEGGGRDKIAQIFFAQNEVKTKKKSSLWLATFFRPKLGEDQKEKRSSLRLDAFFRPKLIFSPRHIKGLYAGVCPNNQTICPNNLKVFPNNQNISPFWTKAPRFLRLCEHETKFAKQDHKNKAF